MTVTPSHEIIDEIDAYLSRLRQAGELLLDRKTEASQKRPPRRKRRITPRQADQASSRSTEPAKNKARSNHPMAHLKKSTERVDVSTKVPSPVAQQVARYEHLAITEPESTIPQSVVIKRLPAKGSRTSIRSVRHRTPKSNPAATPDAPKPAIALAGPRDARIVVVPAEQVRRERAAQPEVQRPRVPASCLTGRLAFEALFK